MRPRRPIRAKSQTPRIARRYDLKEVRDTIGALDRAGVSGKDIWRRLREGKAGLRCGSIGISQRMVYHHRLAYRNEHGPPARETITDASLETIGGLETRTIRLLAREIAALERKRPGKLTPADSRALAAHHRTLVDIERRARTLRRAKANGDGTAEGEDDKPESAIERLARELASKQEAREVSEDADR